MAERTKEQRGNKIFATTPDEEISLDRQRDDIAALDRKIVRHDVRLSRLAERTAEATSDRDLLQAERDTEQDLLDAVAGKP